MTWVIAGVAAVGAATSLYSANQAASSSARAASARSRAEGEAVVRERLNATIRASFQTALAQRQLGLQKQQLAQQAFDVRSGALGARSEVQLGAAATETMGGSVQALHSDIDMRSQEALAKVNLNLENAVDNYNDELQMMVINMEQTTPNIQKYEYTGPSSGQMLGSAVIGGLSQFASAYAQRSMSLGLGPRSPGNAGTGLSTGGYLGLQAPRGW